MTIACVTYQVVASAIASIMAGLLLVGPWIIVVEALDRVEWGWECTLSPERTVCYVIALAAVFDPLIIIALYAWGIAS